MSKLTDKVSYLKGLAAGMKLNMEKDSNKLLLEILGAMGDRAEEMQRMDEATGSCRTMLSPSTMICPT